MRHLNDGSSSSDNFDIINKRMYEIIKCDVKSCKIHLRYNRNRQRIDNDNNDYNATFYINIMENIHSFDIGFRIPQNMKHKQTMNKNDSNDEDDVDN